MDMSAAALPAHSGRASAADRAHPLYNEWRKAESFAQRQMIDGQDFKNWLYQREQAAYRDDWAKHAQYPAFLSWMRETKAGGRGKLNFPENFKFWLEGGRW